MNIKQHNKRFLKIAQEIADLNGYAFIFAISGNDEITFLHTHLDLEDPSECLILINTLQDVLTMMKSGQGIKIKSNPNIDS